MTTGLVNDNILASISPNVCSIDRNSALCSMKEYLQYIVELTNEAFNNCAIQFAASGLRFLLELITLAVYVDTHHVYKNKLILEKLSLIQSFSLGSILGRSTFFRRVFVKVLGSKDSRILIDNMKMLHRTLSRYMHGPPASCLANVTLFNPCTCVEELRVLRDIAGNVVDLVRKIVYVWTLVIKGS